MADKSNRHDYYCLRYELGSEQIHGALLQGNGLCDLFKPHGIADDRFDSNRAPGNGGNIGKEGAEATNRQTIVGQLRSGRRHIPRIGSRGYSRHTAWLFATSRGSRFSPSAEALAALLLPDQL